MTEQKNVESNQKDNSSNPLLEKSKLSFGAFPFARLENSHYIRALDSALPLAQKRINDLATSTAAPTFENTIIELECLGETVGHIATIFFCLLGVCTDNELQKIAQEISPKLADFSSDIVLNAQIFEKVKAVYEFELEAGKKGTSRLSTEQWTLTEKTYKNFVRNGGLLDEKKKERLRALDQELSQLSLKFGNNSLHATNAFKLLLDKKEDLQGLPPSAIESARAEAAQAGEKDKWLITLEAPSFVPFLTYSERRDLREKVWRAYASRCLNDQFDNQEVIKQTVGLRHERAQLLGYKSHAHFVLEERMAETPEKVLGFLNSLLNKTKAAAQSDLDELDAYMKSISGPSEIKPWDFSFYSEKLQQHKFNFDQEELRPYFQLDKVIQGVFAVASRLYDLNFRELKDIPVYHPDVKTYEVLDRQTSRFIGLLYMDFFPRPSKRNGAWMTSLKEQGLFDGTIERPHVMVVGNFTKPTSEKPSLLNLDEVLTLFHEFGHALHGLLSDCQYCSTSGTNVYWDFVELPSQIMENWVLEKEALDLFATHYETGEKMPEDLAKKIRESSNFQAGWNTLRQLNFALLDMAWHSQDPSNIDSIEEFEEKITAQTSLLPRIKGTSLSTGFSHIFSGGYSAGYYSYKWAEVLDADAFEFFKTNGLFNSEIAKLFRESILARGGTEHPMTLYKKFRGREPDPDALLRRSGLLPTNG